MYVIIVNILKIVLIKRCCSRKIAEKCSKLENFLEILLIRFIPIFE